LRHHPVWVATCHSNWLAMSNVSLITLLARQSDGDNVIHPPNPVVSFVIGLAIIILASILNAAGLNLTKLDHVCGLDPCPTSLN
jgi:hypothetical protein